MFQDVGFDSNNDFSEIVLFVAEVSNAPLCRRRLKRPQNGGRIWECFQDDAHSPRHTPRHTVV